jgi:hypothetical protein
MLTLQRTCLAVGCLLVFSSLLIRSVPADEFRLKDGRVLTGRVATAKTDSSQKWTVEVAPGAFVRFDHSEVAHNGHIRLNDRLTEYEKRLATVEPTAKSHGELANWCASKGLRDHAEAHYTRALDFDPNFDLARAYLKHIKDENGRWVRRDDLMLKQKGKVKSGNKYVFPEVLAMEKAENELAEKMKPFKRDLREWSKEIQAGKANAAKALEKLRQVNDPLAIPVLGSLLLDNKPTYSVELRLEYVRLLAQFQLPEAADKLVRASMFDNEPIVRERCLDAITQYGREMAIGAYMGYLRSTKVEQINRAAIGLRVLKADSSILSLIDALVTQHKVQVKNTPTYDNSGTTVFGGDKPKTEIRPSQNEEVLAALTSLTGQNFEYSEGAWKAWFAQKYAPAVGDLRRD